MPGKGAHLWSVYRLKIRFDGKVYPAPKHVTRKSINVKKINDQLRALKGQANHPVELAKKRCIDKGEAYQAIVYKGGKKIRTMRANADCFWRELASIMKETIKEVTPLTG